MCAASRSSWNFNGDGFGVDDSDHPSDDAMYSMSEVRKEQQRLTRLLQYTGKVPDYFRRKKPRHLHSGLYTSRHDPRCSRLDPDGEYRDPADDFMRQGLITFRGAAAAASVETPRHLDTRVKYNSPTKSRNNDSVLEHLNHIALRIIREPSGSGDPPQPISAEASNISSNLNIDRQQIVNAASEQFDKLCRKNADAFLRTGIKTKLKAIGQPLSIPDVASMTAETDIAAGHLHSLRFKQRSADSSYSLIVEHIAIPGGADNDSAGISDNDEQCSDTSIDPSHEQHRVIMSHSEQPPRVPDESIARLVRNRSLTFDSIKEASLHELEKDKSFLRADHRRWCVCAAADEKDGDLKCGQCGSVGRHRPECVYTKLSRCTTCKCYRRGPSSRKSTQVQRDLSQTLLRDSSSINDDSSANRKEGVRFYGVTAEEESTDNAYSDDFDEYEESVVSANGTRTVVTRRGKKLSKHKSDKEAKMHADEAAAIISDEKQVESAPKKTNGKKRKKNTQKRDSKTSKKIFDKDGNEIITLPLIDQYKVAHTAAIEAKRLDEFRRHLVNDIEGLNMRTSRVTFSYFSFLKRYKHELQIFDFLEPQPNRKVKEKPSTLTYGKFKPDAFLPQPVLTTFPKLTYSVIPEVEE